MTNALISSPAIDGTITDAGLQEQAILSIERKYAWSIIETVEYATYNIVTKQIIKQYTVKEFTTFACHLPWVLFGGVVGIIFCLGIWDSMHPSF